ncbi:unnamed protein product [Calicophoron daubneyi]|uniref:Uncharacterized protein n=1 Tax=Calicophoron daubneyi TaxID=300641 RepID=A0AAV2SY42_CALDB
MLCSPELQASSPKIMCSGKHSHIFLSGFIMGLIITVFIMVGLLALGAVTKRGKQNLLPQSVKPNSDGISSGEWITWVVIHLVITGCLVAVQEIFRRRSRKTKH